MKRLIYLLSFILPLWVNAQMFDISALRVTGGGNPAISLNPAFFSQSFTTQTGTNSQPQNTSVVGTSLVDNILISLSGSGAGVFRLSLDNSSYASTKTINRIGSGASGVLYCRVDAGASAGTYTAVINFQSANATTQTINISATVSSIPGSITPNPTSVTGLTTVLGSPGIFQNVTINATGLGQNISWSVDAGVDGSSDNGITPTSSGTIPQSGGSINNFIFKIRANGASLGNFSGNLHLVAGSVSVDVPYSGNVTSGGGGGGLTAPLLIFQANFSQTAVNVPNYVNKFGNPNCYSDSLTIDIRSGDSCILTTIPSRWDGGGVTDGCGLHASSNTLGVSGSNVAPSNATLPVFFNYKVTWASTALTDTNMNIKVKEKDSLYTVMIFVGDGSTITCPGGRIIKLVLFDSTNFRRREVTMDVKANLTDTLVFKNVKPNALGKFWLAGYPNDGGSAGNCSQYFEMSVMRVWMQPGRMGFDWSILLVIFIAGFITWVESKLKKKLFWLGFVSLMGCSTLKAQPTETHDMITYDTTFQLPGSSEPIWIARITRPNNLFTANHADTASRPGIFFMPGDGELGPAPGQGTDPANLVVSGPHWQINNGWDGGVMLGNGKHYPILISVICNANDPRGVYINQMLDTMRRRYHIKTNSLYCVGLSKGAMSWTRTLAYAQNATDESSMQKIKAICLLEGESGAVDGYNFSNSIPLAVSIGHWANKYGGRIFALQGSSDGIHTNVTPKASNDSLDAAGKPRNAFFVLENFGGGGHCCWNSFMAPSLTNFWTWVNKVTNATYPNYLGNYFEPSNVWQWMLRQGDSSLVGGCAPIGDVGPDQTVYVPFDAYVYPKITLSCSATSGSGVLTQKSGPNTAIINQAPKNKMVDLSNGTSANQQTRYFQPHSDWLNQSNATYLTALKDKAGVKTMRIPADPSLTIIPTNFDSLNMAHMPYLDSVVFRNLAVGFNVMIDFCHDLGAGTHIFDSIYTPGSIYRTGFPKWQRAIVKHYKDLGIDTNRLVFEIWNEPKDPGAANVLAQYDLLDSAIKYIRQIDSSYWVGATGFGSNTATFTGMNINTTGNYKMRVYSAYKKIFYIYHGYVPGLLIFQGKQAANNQGTYNLPYPATHATATKIIDSVIFYDCATCNGTYGTPFIGTKGELWTYAHTQTWNWDFMDSIFKNVFLFGEQNNVPLANTEWSPFQYGDGDSTGTLRPVRLRFAEHYQKIHRRYNIGANLWDPNGVTTRLDSNMAINNPIRMDDTLVRALGFTRDDGTLYDKMITITNLTSGTYVFTWTVTDNLGGTSSDDITIVVLPKQTPIANAGTDQNITLPINSTIPQNVSATARGGAFVSTTVWTQTSGPNTAIKINDSTLSPTFSNLVTGTYLFRLTILDNNNSSNFDEVQITVLPNGTIQRDYPFFGLGEYQSGVIASDGKWWAVSAVAANIGMTGATGIYRLVPVTPSTLTFLEAQGALHGISAIDIMGRPWVCGDNANGQYGNGTTTSGTVPVLVTQDADGNPLPAFDHGVWFFVNNSAVGAYFWKEGDTVYYIAGANICGMAGNGTLGSAVNTRWQKYYVPDGKQVLDMKGGYHGIMKCTDGSLYTTGGGSISGPPGNYNNLGYSPTNASTDYLTWKKIVNSGVKLIAGGMNFDYYYTVDNHLFGWGAYTDAYGKVGTAASTTIWPLDTVLLNKMDAPLKEITVNHHSSLALTTNNSMYGWGDAVQGTVGSDTSLDFAHATPIPYAWDFVDKVIIGYPQRINGLTPMKHIYGATPFVFYFIASDFNGNGYGWGRNKSTPMCFGLVPLCSQQESTYAAWQIYKSPKLIDSFLTRTTTYKGPCPICITYPDTTDCAGGCAPVPGFPSPVANAGINQVIGSDSTVLNGGASVGNGFIWDYHWQYVSGPQFPSLDLISGKTMKVKNLGVGVSTFRLTVTNNGQFSNSSLVTVTRGIQIANCDCVIVEGGKVINTQTR